MNTEQVLGLLRQVLPLLGGMAVTFGFLTPTQVASWTNTAMQIAGPLMILGSAVWSMFDKTEASTVAKASAIPGVSSITVNTPALATAAKDADPRTEVKMAAGSAVVPS